MLDIASVLKGDKASASLEDDYEFYASELATALGISKEKAETVARAVCALARYELDKSKSDKSSSVTIKVG